MAREIGWHRARQEARRLRGSIEAVDEALDDALRLTGLRARPRFPFDPLLSGSHAVLDAEAQTIWFRADASPEERRLLLAHEIGHFLLHHDGLSDEDEEDAEAVCQCCTEDDLEDTGNGSAGDALTGYGPRQRREAEANVFAREFLLPAPLARRWFFEEELDAHAIALRGGVSTALVFSQLGEAEGSGRWSVVSGQWDSGPLPPPPSPIQMGEGETENPREVVSPPTTSLRLDPSQEAAARAETGPLLVGAGPGTGKTRTLTARVLFLTRERGVPPENILALTFSRKATEEMRERIGAQAPEVAARACISTFHSYGLDLLRRHWQAAGLPPRPVLLEMVDAFALLERRVASLNLSALRYLHDPAYPLPDILRAVSRAKEEMLTPQEYAARAEASGDEKLRDVARVYAAYEELLREKGALDFADLICRSLRLLETNPDVLQSERARWRHILVDEYQDINRAGARLVRLLSGGDGTGLWAVGDLRQAIYAFRGASPANVSQFQSDFPDGRRADLAVNYRSRPSLVGLFGAVCGEGTQAWQALRDGDATITMAVAPDETAQADGIARSMNLLRETGHSYREQVVLCRTRGQATALRAALTERGIPVAAAPEENNLLARPEARRLLALLSQSCEPDGPAGKYLAETAEKEEGGLRLSPDAIPFAADAYEFFTEALWGKPGLARQVTDQAAVARLVALARAFRERSGAILEPSDEPRRAFLAHVRRMARLGSSFGVDEASSDDELPDAVRILTVHASKGLEFPVVFVPNLSAGKFPSRPAPSLLPSLPLFDEDADADAATANADEEEARLFFVALTRARDHLILSRAVKYNGRAAAPSPLLACLDSAKERVRQAFWEGEKAPALTPSDTTPLCRAPSPNRSGFAGGRGGTGKKAASASLAALSVSTPPRGAEDANATGPPLPIVPASPVGEGARHKEVVSEGVRAGDSTAPVTAEAWEAELYDRCPRRFYYERVEKLSGKSSPYTAFKRAMQGLLGEEDPAAALDAFWAENGPDSAHPHAPLYRRAAEEIAARIRESQSAAVDGPGFRRGGKADETGAAPAQLSLKLENGTIIVQADACDETGAHLEYHTFRKPPQSSENGDGETAAAVTSAPPDMRLSLLYEAASAAAAATSGSGDVSVHLRYLLSGDALPVADKPKIRQRHLDTYENALRGIRLRVFPASPGDKGDCPTCPFFFICPE